MAPNEPLGTLTAMDGATIPYLAWGDDRSQHAIVLLHGAGPYSRIYERLALALAERGIATLAYDQRGFGATSGPRGHSPHFAFYLDDCAIALSAAAARWPFASVSLVGHAFGGLVATRYCLERASRRGPAPSSLVLLAPWIRDRLPVKKRTIAEGVIRAVTAPTHTYPVPISLWETCDPQNVDAVAAAEADPLFVREVSGRWWVGSTRAKIGIIRKARNLTLPVLQIEGTEDVVIDGDTNRRLFLNIGSEHKRLVVLPGFFHDFELQRDLDPLVTAIGLFLTGDVVAVA